MQSRTKGILAITASAFGFALMALFVRLCDDYGASISSFQKSFFRNVVALAIAAAAWARARRTLDGRRETRDVLSLKSKVLLIFRSLLGTVGIFANFYALSHITIAEGQTLNKTAPFFTVVFAWIFLGEKATRRQVLPLVLAFLGVVFIAKPGPDYQVRVECGAELPHYDQVVREYITEVKDPVRLNFKTVLKYGNYGRETRSTCNPIPLISLAVFVLLVFVCFWLFKSTGKN